MAITKIIKDKTKAFIDKYADTFAVSPIELRDIIKAEGIDILEQTLPDDLSGLLIIKGESKLIGVNFDNKPVRKRFTLAHELGHFVLHKDESSIFKDNQLFKRQSEGYSSREERMEQEANYFAASILMPEILVRREVESLHKDLHDEENLMELADRFQVSLPAMTFRLINLGLI